ncbi:apolipoprotein N-acyltransferase [Blastococcus brunescens]|uniref:Apolipoprotein N-acyltransferase n=1 Tax=Blastococcus brunescens TaxID=1564165 RepID=A0ABZ1B6K3_9ACTN|nr:apolipoprotein N-acyltransferase [Blastococcus sp. BMG 8361]WRL66416.1 apolipoprotein N-acyltransferase [Blastococcus sp. BMG 8361]
MGRQEQRGAWTRPADRGPPPRRRARGPVGRGPGLAAAARAVAHRGRAHVDGRRHPGRRAAGRAGLQRPASCRARQPRPAHPRARRGGGGGEEPQPDAVIWPENSSDIDPYTNADAARQIDRAATAIGAPILVGAVVQGPGEFLSNTAIVWDPADGPGDTYVKRHPVPLAEYVPARDFFRFFSDKVDLVRRNFIAGDEVGVLDVGGVRLGDLICFEVVYDGLVHDVVDGGAGMIVVQTNNATFGYTDESAQQLAMSRLRAVEFGRTVVVAATSGISAIVAPDGSIAESSELFTPDVFVESIAERSSSTVARRLGSVPEWTVTAVGVAALLAAAWPGVRARRQRRAAR